MESNQLLEKAHHFVERTNQNIFLTGKAGTGKTTFLRNLCELTYKRFVVVAPTGIAALNAGGVTVHSQFLMPLGLFVPSREPAGTFQSTFPIFTNHSLLTRHPLNAARKKVLREIDLLIIDEVSMLRADVLDAIDFRLKHAKRNFKQPFGGVQLLMIGDLFQLPPIVKDQERQVMRQFYESPFFFHSQALREGGFVHIELEKIYRQSDAVFIDLLNNLRNNTVTAQDIATLNAHYKSEEERNKLDGVVTLTTHNYKADTINKKHLDELPGKAKVYQAEVHEEFPESMYPLEERISLKVGTQVMFIKNDPEGAYFNGKLAKVVEITKGDVFVQMQGEEESYKLKQERWENKRYVIDDKSKELEEETIGTFIQYPIRLAWAITVHKSQGLTFEKAIIDVGQAFASGQVYVALSRLKSLEGLTLGTKVDPRVISNNQEVVDFTAAKPSQEQLDERLTKSENLYVYQLLMDTFNFDKLKLQVQEIQKKHSSKTEFEDEQMRAALPSILRLIENEEETTSKFRNQLHKLLVDNKREVLQERIEKGAMYYRKKLFDIVRLTLFHIEQVQFYSKTKAYVNALQEFDQLLNKQLERIVSANGIVLSVLQKKEVTDLNQQLATLLKERDQMLSEVIRITEELAPKSKRKTGKKRKKSSGPQEVGATYQETLKLAQEGFKVDEIAKKRDMAKSTIEGHFSKLIKQGDLDIHNIMSADTVDAVVTIMKDKKPNGLGELMKLTQNSYDYPTLRMIQAHLYAKEKEG